MASQGQATALLSAEQAVDALREARERTLALVDSISDENLERVHSTLLSPLAWDLGHIATFEDLWLVHRFGERTMLRRELAEVYDAFDTPRADRGELPFLGAREVREYLAAVRERTLDVIADRGVAEGTIHELVIRHEQQHNETMLQAIELAHLSDYELGGRGLEKSPSTNGGSAPTGLELIEIPAGGCTIGAPCDRFAYDNERPRHRTDVRGYQIAHTPITNATFLTFVEGGGYERREWWSDEGWAWKEEYDITHPAGWTPDRSGEWRLGKLEPLHPQRPVVHVSWFEADAFARAHGARLPTEVEWEKAATWDQETATARSYPWGSDVPIAGIHANIDQLAGGTAPAAMFPDGASPYGCLGMLGDVWEWTSSDFDGYVGFAAHPYREYSEVFFGDEYKVLRGASWATRARVASPCFRNWDYPQRRQIFSGIRIAKDA